MRTSHLRYVSLAALALTGALAAQACSPTAPEELPLDSGAGDDATVVVDSGKKDTGVAVVDSGKDTGTTPADTGVLTDTGIKETGVADTSVATDGSSDAANDGSADAAAVPATGDACAVKGATFTKPCGFCGKSSAFCEADNKVGTYGFCQGNVVGGCTPGTQRNGACGLCGTRQEICQNTCQWAGGACLGEPADACAPGSVDYTQTGCVDLDKFRTVTCGATCQYSLPEPPPCRVKEPNTVILGAIAGAITSGEFALGVAASALSLPSTGSCPASLSTSTSTANVYLKLVNRNATTATVELYMDAAVGTTPIDSVMTTYTALPTNDAERKACTNRVADDNDEDLVSPAPQCTSTPPFNVSSLCGENAVTVPANSTIYVYVAAYSSAATNFGKKFKISSRVKSL